MLVFEKILVNFSEWVFVIAEDWTFCRKILCLIHDFQVFEFVYRSNGWDYLEFRLWVGVWIAVILIILVATDASALVSYITRFTEDNFATLIALIFMVEVIKYDYVLKYSLCAWNKLCTYRYLWEEDGGDEVSLHYGFQFKAVIYFCLIPTGCKKRNVNWSYPYSRVILQQLISSWEWNNVELGEWSRSRKGELYKYYLKSN